MKDIISTINNKIPLSPSPGRKGAAWDLLVYLGAAFACYGVEKGLRAAGLNPFPRFFDGGFSLIASFFVVVALKNWRGQSWSDFGLRRPPRWWFIPVWGLIIMATNIVMQLTLVPLLATLLGLPQADLSRYDVIHQNLPMLFVAAFGSMFTGGFVEEFIYRGLVIDRLTRIFGGDRRALFLAAVSCGVPFGLIHFEWGAGGMLVTTVMGSVLGLMFLVTKRNLWPLIAAHASLDVILMIQVYFQGTG